MTSYEFCQRMLPQDSYSWKPRVNHLDPRRRSCCPCDGGAHWLRVTLKSLKSFEGPKKSTALERNFWVGRVCFFSNNVFFCCFFLGEQVYMYIYILWILCTYVFEGMIRFIYDIYIYMICDLMYDLKQMICKKWESDEMGVVNGWCFDGSDQYIFENIIFRRCFYLLRAYVSNHHIYCLVEVCRISWVKYQIVKFVHKYLAPWWPKISYKVGQWNYNSYKEPIGWNNHSYPHL